MHSPEAGNRAGDLAGVLRPLTAGPSGSGASPRFSGWPVRPGSCRPSPAPRPWSPGTEFQWPPLSPSPSPGIPFGKLRTGADTPPPPRHGAPGHCPRSHSAVQRAPSSTGRGRPPRSRSCCCPPVPSTPPHRSPGTLPSSSWPSPHTAGWWSQPEPALVKTGGRFTLQHPLAPQFRVRPEVGLISKEYSGFSPLRLVPQGGVLLHE